MIGFKIDQAKGMFFDSSKVIRAVDRATRRVLSKFGAYVRTAAKSSIRKRKGASEPGKPPSSHTGLLKRYLYFGYEPDRQSVVIGPARMNVKSGSIPETLEYGGTTTIRSGRYRTNEGKRRFKSTRRVQIAARPFMQPALQQELPKLPAMWRDSVRP